MELTSSVLSVKQAARHQSAQIAVIKKQHEMEKTLINMVDKVAHSAPRPGHGTRVDRTA